VTTSALPVGARLATAAVARCAAWPAGLALAPVPSSVVAPAATTEWGGAGAGRVALLLGAAWAITVAAVTATALRRHAHRRPGAGRLPRPPAPAAFGPPFGGPGGGVVHRSPIVALGSAVRRLSPAPTPRSAPTDRVSPARWPADEAADRRAGWAVLAGLGLLAVAPPLAAVPVVWSVTAPVVAARRRRAATDARLHDQLPDVVDLLALTAGAGLPVGAALEALGDRPGGPLGAALARAGAHVRHGGSTAEALALLSAAGPGARPLVDALAQHDRYGSPLLPALERVAIEARARRRRRAEEAARRLPVTLLLPLVLTTFPAFVLLTVIPLLAGSLGSLSLSPT
jgi:tight adherence protein C